MTQQVIVFIHTARATRQDFAEAEQKAHSTRIYFFGMLIPVALLLCALFIFSLLRSWETALWGPAIITSATFITTILVFMSVARRLTYPRQSELEDMRLVRQAIASNSASIRNVLTEGSNSKPPTTTEDNASHIRLHSLRVSSDRALAQLLFGRGVSIIFLSIVVASVFLFLLIAGSIPEFWQTVWREGVGPMLLTAPNRTASPESS